MRKPVQLLLILSTLVFAQFDAPFIFQANGVNLVADIICDPVFTDWNGDGLNAFLQTSTVYIFTASHAGERVT
ncbi:MAG: hypothetical protein R6V62_09200 [Candidatus Fermentibacteraceae bacterium]